MGKKNVFLSRPFAQEDMFGKYGKIRTIAMKLGFAFVDFEDVRDAEDSVRELNRSDYDGACAFPLPPLLSSLAFVLVSREREER
jgi:RNA recognition motif-containing protein